MLKVSKSDSVASISHLLPEDSPTTSTRMIAIFFDIRNSQSFVSGLMFEPRSKVTPWYERLELSTTHCPDGELSLVYMNYRCSPSIYTLRRHIYANYWTCPVCMATHLSNLTGSTRTRYRGRWNALVPLVACYVSPSVDCAMIPISDLTHRMQTF